MLKNQYLFQFSYFFLLYFPPEILDTIPFISISIRSAKRFFALIPLSVISSSRLFSTVRILYITLSSSLRTMSGSLSFSFPDSQPYSSKISFPDVISFASIFLSIHLFLQKLENIYLLEQQIPLFPLPEQEKL